jgi:preprotein translocase subunit YajC
MKKATLITLASLAVVYASIYFYQRYQRQKANERKSSIKEADEIIDDL